MPAIFEASRYTLQPGGIHLPDPDQIDIGQTLTIPGKPAAATPAPTPESSTTTPTPAPATSRPNPRPEPVEPDPVTPIPAGAAQSAATSHATADTSEHVTTAPWMLAGLSGGGALLAGSMLMLLRRRRRAQFRNRRPGRTLASPEPVLSPVEKITVVGAVTAPTVDHMDQVLRRLAAATAADGTPMPVVAAVELTQSHLVLHLSEPSDLPQPWEGTPDRLHWKISPTIPLEQIGPELDDQPAPYPLLVTIGLGERVWLLNIEASTSPSPGTPPTARISPATSPPGGLQPWSAGSPSPAWVSPPNWAPQPRPHPRLRPPGRATRPSK